MLLASVLVNDRARLAVVEKGQVFLVSSPEHELTYSELFYERPLELLSRLERADLEGPVASLDSPLEPPVPRPSKIIGVGKNYAAHAREMRSVERTVFFMKAPSALTGHRHEVVVPPEVAKPDYEGEIVIVIGKAVRRASEAEAKGAILGYMAGNDVTARDLQYDECMPWCLSKSVDTFSPTGPYLKVVQDYSELEDLCLETRLNGDVVQKGCAREMMHSFAELIVELSKYMTLRPGDLIFTGTPPGVGHPRGRYLQDGDMIEVSITGLDALVNVVSRPASRAA